MATTAAYIKATPAEFAAFLSLSELDEDIIGLISKVNPPKTSWLLLASGNDDEIRKALTALSTPSRGKTETISEFIYQQMIEVSGPTVEQLVSQLSGDDLFYLAKKAKDFSSVDANFVKFLTDTDAIETFALSLEVAIENTAICILLGYPAAWILANKNLNKSAVTIVLFILPMWINALMRTLGKGTLIVGMVYDYLPFMIYPIYNILDKMDKSYAEAAADLGATPWQVFWKVQVPLSMPGIISGVMMVFMPTVSTFAISEFLTNNKIKLFGTIIQENINSSMWNYGAALSLVMLVIIGITSLLQDNKKEVSGGMV